MTAGVVGLGLIGGSLARAYKAAGHTVLGFDTDESVLQFAQVSRVVGGVLDGQSLGQCQLLFLAVNPGDAVAWLEGAARDVAKDALVMDCCGVKRFVCERCFPLAERHGFTFVGGHPMAGNHRGGFKHSNPALFRGASIILVPPVYDDAALFGRVEEALKPAGFAHLTVTTAEKHDQMIAFSSQMAHIVSNAYIKSPAAEGHKGFSAGSYRDLTRVAQLNAAMWAELCMLNRDCLMQELDGLAAALARYRDALAAQDSAGLEELLEAGSRRKKELDSR